MEMLVADMTKEEFKQMLESIVERKLLELFGDLEEIDLKPEVKARLLHQQKMVLEGERGQAFDDVLQQLDLN